MIAILAILPILIIPAVLAILFCLWLVIKLKNSPTFDKVVNEITEEHDLDEPKTGEVIKGIDEAEKSLKDRSKQHVDEIKRLEKDNKQIGDYLGKKGKGK